MQVWVVVGVLVWAACMALCVVFIVGGTVGGYRDLRALVHTTQGRRRAALYCSAFVVVVLVGTLVAEEFFTPSQAYVLGTMAGLCTIAVSAQVGIRRSRARAASHLPTNGSL